MADPIQQPVDRGNTDWELGNLSTELGRSCDSMTTN